MLVACSNVAAGLPTYQTPWGDRVETSARTPHLVDALDSVLQTPLDAVPSDQVNRVLRRIMANEVSETIADVAAFNSAI
jgi:hypothetical protein